MATIKADKDPNFLDLLASPELDDLEEITDEEDSMCL